MLGREREREALDGLLDGARAARGGVVVIHGEAGVGFLQGVGSGRTGKNTAKGNDMRFVLYKSDAADDLLCVDLGGRRFIKKKNK